MDPELYAWLALERHLESQLLDSVLLQGRCFRSIKARDTQTCPSPTTNYARIRKSPRYFPYLILPTLSCLLPSLLLDASQPCSSS